jgi:succinate-acetate transporter protein
MFDFFKDHHGDPDFKGLGPILKAIFIIYLLYLVVKKEFKVNVEFLFVLFLYAIACFLNLKRYLEIEDHCDNVLFMHVTAYENLFIGSICMYAAFVSVFHYIKFT